MNALDCPPGHMLRLAKERVPVTVTSERGARTGRLTYWPNGRDGRRSPGGRARVQLPSGAYLSVPTADISVTQSVTGGITQ